MDKGDGGSSEKDKGLFGQILPAPVRVAPGNADLVGFGRVVSDLGLTASIYDVMVSLSVTLFSSVIFLLSVDVFLLFV